LDSFVNPTATDTLDSATVPHAAQHDNINDAMSAVQVTLGVNPQGGSATVVARLTALDSTVAGKAATNQTMYVGTTAIAINRSSASQTLTGVSIDGNAATATSATTAGSATTATSATTAGSATTAANLSGTQTAKFVYAAPNATSGTASFRALVASDIPTLNQDTTGTAKTITDTTLPLVTSVNSTTIPASSTLITTATTSLPNVTSVNSTTIPASSTLITPSSTNTLTNKSVDGSTNTLSNISDSSLNTISTAGKVSNSATTAVEDGRIVNLGTTSTIDLFNRQIINTTRSMTAGIVYLTGFVPAKNFTLNSVTVDVRAAGTGTLYALLCTTSSATPSVPTVVANTTGLATPSTGTQTLTFSTAQSLTAGNTYAIAFYSQGGTCTLSGNVLNAASHAILRTPPFVAGVDSTTYSTIANLPAGTTIGQNTSTGTLSMAWARLA
jgi:hypothetical protein